MLLYRPITTYINHTVFLLIPNTCKCIQDYVYNMNTFWVGYTCNHVCQNKMGVISGNCYFSHISPQSFMCRFRRFLPRRLGREGEGVGEGYGVGRFHGDTSRVQTETNNVKRASKNKPKSIHYVFQLK